MSISTIVKVASLTVVGQHPKGLDPHLRNLKQAISQPFDPFIMTFKDWGLKPEATVIEVDEYPMWFYRFWEHTAPSVINSIDADVLVLSETDVYYTCDLAPLIAEAYEGHKIILNNNHYNGLCLYLGEERVYPRIWEGGAIVPLDLLKQAMEYGIRLDDKVSTLLNADFGEHTFKTTLDNVPLRNLHEGGEYDNLFEFTLYCFLNNVQVDERDIACHFMMPETVHRLIPEVYSSITEESFDRFLKILGETERHRWSTSVAMFYLSGVTEWKPMFHKWWSNSSPEAIEQFRRLSSSNLDWMTSGEKERLRHVLKAMSQVYLL